MNPSGWTRRIHTNCRIEDLRDTNCTNGHESGEGIWNSCKFVRISVSALPPLWIVRGPVVLWSFGLYVYFTISDFSISVFLPWYGLATPSGTDLARLESAKNFGKQGLGTVPRPKYPPAGEIRTSAHQTHRFRIHYSDFFGFRPPSAVIDCTRGSVFQMSCLAGSSCPARPPRTGGSAFGFATVHLWS